MKAEQAGALPWSAFGVNPISAKIIVSRFDRRMAFVPEGQAERSQARSAWVTMQRGPVRRDGRSHCQSQAEIGSIVPLDGVIFLMIPGTSCLATIGLSLRDKSHRPSKCLALSSHERLDLGDFRADSCALSCAAISRSNCPDLFA